jgi:hypothetical protein
MCKVIFSIKMYMLYGAKRVGDDVYVLPHQAIKDDGMLYKCIDCDAKVILKSGKVKRAHFAHYAKGSCGYYEHPNESQLHKEAKYRLASWLKHKIPITISWTCCNILYHGKPCGIYEDNITIHTIKYEEGDQVEIEYAINGGIADVAVINNGAIRYVFEIKHTHSTLGTRPEPWFEITAHQLHLTTTPDIQLRKDVEHLYCVRNSPHRYCSLCRIVNEPWVANLPKIQKENIKPCIKCEKIEYSPIFSHGYRQICKECLVKYEKELCSITSIHNCVDCSIPLDKPLWIKRCYKCYVIHKNDSLKSHNIISPSTSTV